MIVWNCAGYQVAMEQKDDNFRKRERLVITPEVVAGCMASVERLNYTVLGDRVNLGARLCSAAGPMECVVDGATAPSLLEEITTESLDSVSLKGFPQPIDAHRLVAPRHLPAHP